MDTLLVPYDKLRDFIRSHKKLLMYSAGAVGVVSSYYLYKRIQPLYTSLRSDLRLMSKISKDMAESEYNSRQIQLLQRFLHNCTVADVTVRNFAIQTRSDLIQRFDVDLVRKKLASNKGTKRSENELELWNEFKVISYTRTVSAVYCISLLNLLIKLQLSIVSRYVLHDNLAQNPTMQLPSLPFLISADDDDESNSQYKHMRQKNLTSPLQAVQPLPPQGRCHSSICITVDRWLATY